MTFLAHSLDRVGSSAVIGHDSPWYHVTRFDDRAGPIGLFFLHFYPFIVVGAGLLLFLILVIRDRRRTRER